MLGWFTEYVFLGARQRRLYSRGPAVLTYHRVGVAPAGVPDPFLYDTVEELDQHLCSARAAGLRLGSLGDAVAGGKPQPHTLAVTFDDGCCSVLENALPVLRKHGLRATLFLVAGRLGGLNEWDLSKDDIPTPLMDPAQVREWIAAGQDIGSHSLTHQNLRKAVHETAREQIFESKRRLEDQFGVAVRHFAFPYGGWRESRVIDLVREAGYECACTTEFGVSASPADRWSLRRITPLTSRQLLRKGWHRIRRQARAGAATGVLLAPHVAHHAQHIHRWPRLH